MPIIAENLDSGGHLLALVKPQFEVGRQGIGKGGRVQDKTLYEEVEKQVRREVQNLGLVTKSYISSSIKGADGNQEFFIFAEKPS